MNKNIDEYKLQLKEFNLDKKEIEKVLKRTLSGIQLLESIYMTGGKYNYLSLEFKNSACKERQDLCQLSSACYSLLREMKGDNENEDN